MNRGGFSFSLCADDFGLSPAVSEGILTALAAKRLSATSAMTTRPSWPQGAKALSAFSSLADIGLHLNLTLGAPLTLMPRLAPNRSLPGIGALMSLARRGALPQDEIRAEIGAQLDAFAEHFGRMPDFVDGHQHVHVLRPIRTWLFDALEARGLKGGLWLRDSSDSILAIVARRIEMKKAAAVAFLARGFAAEARHRGFHCNQGFSGFSNFAAHGAYAADFARYLVRPGRRHLVMCHPGLIDAELAALDPVTDSRPQELEFLLSARFEDCLGRSGASLTQLSKAGF